MNDVTEKTQKNGYYSWHFYHTCHIYYRREIKKPVFIKMEHKRKYRELDDEVKAKISQSTKGKTKTMRHRQNLSRSLKNYWQSVPSRDEHLTMQEYLTGEKNNEVKSSNPNEA